MRHSIRNAKELLCAALQIQCCENSDLCYHELPAKQQLRDAWLRHISRQGNVKGSHLVPNSRAVVCSIHFKEDDYKVGLKRKVLRPTAVPTQFPSYPAYMLPAVSNKHRPVVRDIELHATPPHADEVAGPENCLAVPCSLQGGVKAQECQTKFNLTSFMADTKRNAHHLQMQASRLNERLQELQKTCDGVQEKLNQYEEDRDRRARGEEGAESRRSLQDARCPRDLLAPWGSASGGERQGTSTRQTDATTRLVRWSTSSIDDCVATNVGDWTNAAATTPSDASRQGTLWEMADSNRSAMEGDSVNESDRTRELTLEIEALKLKLSWRR
ncbi:hypothetical protein HPB50_008775 [Hyalomma asiaticum]|uniref:Uncharacterized protein n=1 Tax=Hyalomma asiaticum TaxID=266040 RepID=A0ACB7S7L5_HYAAI|nr:hypothetical protein HPB50_008775 [Hyalomma asiaticum]